MRGKYRFYIGIDTGVVTGYALWDNGDKRLVTAETMKIHDAMARLKAAHGTTGVYGGVFVRVEGARKRKWFGKTSREVLQGAGSIKRDAKIWEDFLTDIGCPFEMVAPKNNKTKLNAESFKKLTGYEGRTNEHSRDAAMLVFGI